MEILFTHAQKTVFTDFIAPWKLLPLSCGLSFVKINNNHKYQCTEFYTDASKTRSLCSSMRCAGPNIFCTKTMNLYASISTAEAYNITMAVEYIIQSIIPKSVIYTDSPSAVTALSSGKSHKNTYFNLLLMAIMSAYSMGLQVTICCVTGHCLIVGNESADRQAASVTRLDKVDVTLLPYTDLKALIRHQLRKEWQEEWYTHGTNSMQLKQK